MNNTIQTKLLSALIDKYERSNFFRADKQPLRRIMLKLYDGGKSEFTYYDIEQSEERIVVNRAVKELAEQQLISYQWMKGEEEHIVAKVWLNLDNVAKTYEYLNRKPKSIAISEVSAEISEMLKQATACWAKAYFQDIQEIVSRKRDFGGAIPKDEKERADLFNTILEIDKISASEVTERVFSIQHFGDSKRFERVIKTRLISVLRKYLDHDDDDRDEDLLRQVGIVKYPEQFEFCGNLSCSFDDGVVNYAPLRSGASICISDIVRGHITISVDVKRILTIENRTNYIEYISRHKSSDEIVIYHGGQYSPHKKKFFLVISSVMPKHCVWEHWGDIDYGGFSMLARLRREIRPSISPYRMNLSELIGFSRFSAPILQGYGEKLTQLSRQPELSDCRECLEYMIANKIKLEQEAMLVQF